MFLLLFLAWTTTPADPSTKERDPTPPTDSGNTALPSGADGDGVSAADGDGDDEDASINPDGTERCNNLDDDCDGRKDEDVGTTWYADADGDGHGDPDQATTACDQPAGTSPAAGDCDDTSALRWDQERTWTGDVATESTSALTSLGGLARLSTIGGSPSVSGNHDLATLAGLEQLRTVGETLEVSSNRNVVDISALLTVQSVGGDFEVSGNSSLGDAAAEDVRDAIGTRTIGGSVVIDDNE